MRPVLTRSQRLSATLAAALVAGSALVSAQAGASSAEQAAGHGPPRAQAAACKLASAQTDLGEGFPIADQALPSRGHLRGLTLFVDFPDHPAPRGSLLKAENNLRSGVEFLNTMSRGALDVTARSSNRWVRMPHPSSDYPFERGLSYEDHVRYIEDAIRAADPDVDFSGVDVVWVVATEAAPTITYSPTTNFLDVTADGNHLTHAITFGYDQWRWGGLVLAHESGHSLGLPDLYTFDAAPGSNPPNYHAAVGGWDLMGLISGQGPEYLAWHRWMLGWLRDSEVACLRPGVASTVHLSAVETGKGTAMAVLPLDEHRALVAESRKPLRYDREIASEGVLLYTIDTTVRTGSGPVRVLDTTPGSTLGLDDAPLGPGRSWTDASSGVTVSVTSSSSTGDVISVSPPPVHP